MGLIRGITASHSDSKEEEEDIINRPRPRLLQWHIDETRCYLEDESDESMTATYGSNSDDSVDISFSG